MTLHGPESAECAALIEAHKACLRAEGFKVWRGGSGRGSRVWAGCNRQHSSGLGLLQGAAACRNRHASHSPPALFAPAGLSPGKMASRVTKPQREKLAQVVGVTGASTRTALECLTATGWSLEAAVDYYYSSGAYPAARGGRGPKTDKCVAGRWFGFHLQGGKHDQPAHCPASLSATGAWNSGRC